MPKTVLPNLLLILRNVANSISYAMMPNPVSNRRLCTLLNLSQCCQSIPYLALISNLLLTLRNFVQFYPALPIQLLMKWCQYYPAMPIQLLKHCYRILTSVADSVLCPTQRCQFYSQPYVMLPNLAKCYQFSSIQYTMLPILLQPLHAIAKFYPMVLIKFNALRNVANSTPNLQQCYPI